MASKSPVVVAGKPSFAKIAAMPPPQKVAKPHNSQVKGTDLPKDSAGSSPAADTSPPGNVLSASRSRSTSHGQAHQDVAAITDGLAKLAATADTPVERSHNQSSTDPVHVTNGLEEDRSHLSSSSTKPATSSSDTKSMASENTFAMDEKESLRPDDSASVQAVDEDEPFFVPPTPARPDPQIPPYGSNSGLRRLLPDGPVAVGHATRRFPMTIMSNPPRFGDIIPNVPPEFLPTETADLPFPANETGVESLQQYPAGSIPPDEKLLEAMGTPKDRLLLLQLEEKFLAFIGQSKDVTLDLPPQNSYERLLAHKLADYYNLARYSPTDSNSIRLYKAVEFRLPLPLSDLVRGIAGSDNPPTGAAAFKIMRRTALSGNKAFNDGSTAASSSIPSKATSEAGAENTSDEGIPSPPDTTSSKDRSKWTREEKEAHYKAARERIFRDFQEAHPSENSTAETSANMSRSSSSSGKKKTHKQKVPRDDSFDARSSYVPGYLGMPYSSQNQYNAPCGASGYQSPYGAQTPNPMSSNYASSATPTYNQYDPSTTFSGANCPVPYPNQYGSNDGWSNPQSAQPGGYYNFMQQPGPGYPPYGSGMSSPVNQYPQMSSPAFQSPQQQWSQSQYQQPYPVQSPLPPPVQAPVGQNGAPMAWPTYPPHQNAPSPSPVGPYQYAQAPFQQYSSTPPLSNQHPLPGSYSRPAFNPQTRSFVPRGPNMRFGGQASQGRAMNSPFAVQAGNGTQYPENPENGARSVAALNKAQESLQKKWGTPAHLPKKPPPSQVPATLETENTPTLPNTPKSFPPLASSIAKVSTPIGNN